MTITLKPRGRGNWKTVVLTVEGERVLPMYFYVGDSITLGGIVYRICTVHT